MIKRLVSLCLLITGSYALANDNIVNVYCWAGYISSDVINQFEKSTGIRVNFNQYSNNEELYAKLKNLTHNEYDVIVPSADYVTRMVQENMLEKLDKKRLSNFKNLDPMLLDKAFDPNNNYSLPFYWGANIIAINTRYHKPADVQTWKALWSPKYRNQLLILNDVYDAFSMGLIANGYPLNSRDPKQINRAYLAFKALWPNVKLLNSDAVQSLLSDEDVTIGLAWTGDIYGASQENSNITGVYPKEGFGVWMDNISIPKHPPHLSNAYRFINFLLRAEVAKQLADFSGFATPNLAGRKLLAASVRNNRLLYPSAKTMQRAQFEAYTGRKADAIYKAYWEKFRLGA